MKYSFYVTFESENKSAVEEVTDYIRQRITRDDIKNIRVISWTDIFATAKAALKHNEVEIPGLYKIPKRKRETVDALGQKIGEDDE